MGAFDHFPYTNFHELNLQWILQTLYEIQVTMKQFVSLNTIKYADPIQWNIISQYEKNTIVIDPQTGTAYISVQPVPSGVSITNTDYWTVVFDLGDFVVKMAQNLCAIYEPETTLTATVPSNYNDWLIWNDTLYRNINPGGIVAGDTYVIGGNIEAFTVEDVVGHIQDLTTTDKNNLVAAINEVLQTLTDTCGDLANLTTTDKTNLVAAINELLQTLTDTCGDLANLTTTDKTNLVAAINEVNTTGGGALAKIGDLDNLITNDHTDLVSAINEVDSTLLNKIFIDVTNPPTGYTPAVPNDQSIDNGPILQTLINDFAFVYIPNGTYYIQSSIYILESDRYILSDGASIKIADSVNTNLNIFILITSDANKDIRNISLHDLVLDGNRVGRGIANDLSNNTLFLAFTNDINYVVENIELDRVEFIGSAGFAALLGGHDNGNDMSNYFTRNIWIHGCSVHNNFAYVGTSGVNNVIVENCHLYDNDSENICFDNGSANCIMRACTIGTSNGGIGSVGIGMCINALIENNDFDYENNTANLSNYRNCITLKNTNNNAGLTIIRGNIFKRATNAAIYIDYDVNAATSISAEIVSNIFQGCNEVIINNAPDGKGLIKCDMILGQPNLPDNAGNGNIIFPPLYGIWSANADSFVVAGDTFLNFGTHLIYHKIGTKNTYGVPSILFRGYYKIYASVMFAATTTGRVALQIMVNGTVVASDTCNCNAGGYNNLEANREVICGAGDTVNIYLINFDSSNTLTFESGYAAIEYQGEPEANLTDFVTY